MHALKAAMREATALGAQFRVVGADIEIDGELPDPVAAVIGEHLDSGYLHSWLDFDGSHSAALHFGRSLGVEAVLVETEAAAKDAAAEIDVSLKRSGMDYVGLDIETWTPGRRPRPVAINTDGTVSSMQRDDKDRSGLDPHQANIATLQLYGGGKRCFVFRGEALRTMVGSRWLRQHRLVCHNAGFELRFLKHHAPPVDVEKPLPVECTQQAVGLLHGVRDGRHWSLADATVKLALGMAPPKGLQTSCWGAKRLSPGQLSYATSDAVLAHRLWERMEPELHREQRWKAYQLQRDAIPATVDMMLRGLGLDPREHALQVETWARELADARNRHIELTGKKAPEEDAELRSWIIEHADAETLESWFHTDRGKLSTAAGDLTRLRHIPGAEEVLAIKAKTTLLQDFGPSLIKWVNPVTKRVHADYSVAGTKAGRFSASHPNLQQLPARKAPDFRRCIVAEAGNVLVGGDWSQIELRAAAWKSRDRNLTAVFADGRDLHTETAALVARVPKELVTPAQRSVAKAINFGAIYGGGPGRLAATAFANGINITEAESKDALDRFFGEYRQLNQWMWNQYHAAKASGRVHITGGRVVDAEWQSTKRISRPQACNLPIQGLAANAMLRAIRLAYQRFKKLDGGLVACVHDELLVEVAEADAEQAKETLSAVMIEAFEFTFPGAPTKGLVDVGVGRTWKEVKP